MRVFVTGASGWIGSSVVPDLLAHGHQVVGLARSDASLAKVEAAGATALRGGLEDLDVLRAGAADADAVVHLAYNHDFSRMDAAAELDRAALTALAEQLRGTQRPLAVAAGLLGLPAGTEVTEDDGPDPDGWAHPRFVANRMVLDWADDGLNASLVRLAPTVHGVGDHGFVATYASIARERSLAGYLGAGTEHWPAVHVTDAATLFRLAIENPTPGAVLHASAEIVELRELAAAVGERLGLPVGSVPSEQASEHFGWLGTFLAVDVVASSALTRQRYGWQPAGPTLLADIAAGAYLG